MYSFTLHFRPLLKKSDLRKIFIRITNFEKLTVYQEEQTVYEIKIKMRQLKP